MHCNVLKKLAITRFRTSQGDVSYAAFRLIIFHAYSALAATFAYVPEYHVESRR